MPPAPKRFPFWISLLPLAVGVTLLSVFGAFIQVVPLPRDVQPLLVVAMIGVGALSIVGTLVLTALEARRDEAMVDTVFAGMGLTARRSFFEGRTYRGVFAGRPIEARYAPTRRYAPSSIEIRVGASPRTALAIELRNLSGTLLGNIDDGREVPIADPQYQHLLARAPDAARAGRALRDPAVMEAILRPFRDPPGAPSITITPDAVSLRMAVSPEALDGGIARTWATDLVALAHLVEALPPT